MDYPGEKFILRLWETIAEKGIGSLLSPWQTRREGRSQIELRREEILAIAQAEKDADAIRSGKLRFEYGKGMKPFLTTGSMEAAPASALSAIVKPEIPFVEQVCANKLADDIRSEVNTAKALLHAEADLGNEPGDPPEKTIDTDWLFRWRESAGQTSSSELQNLWGRLLAGEIKSPGSFSLRTLDFLKNISSTEAVSIAKLSPFIINGIVARDAMDILENDGITLAVMLELQQLGIISGAEAIGLQISWGSVQSDRFIRPLLSNGRVILATSDDTTKNVSLQAFQVTQIGQQILTLGKFSPNETYLRKLCSVIKEQGFSVSIADYINISAGQIQWFNEEHI